MSKTHTCSICKHEIYNIRLGRHLKVKHSTTLIDYLVKHHAFIVPTCKFCENKCELKYGSTYKKICGSKECARRLLQARVMSEETRKKIGKSVTRWMIANPEKTAFGRRAGKEPSWPEKFFTDQIMPRLDMGPVEIEKSILQYHIDFAFTAFNLAVEIDGKQHQTPQGKLRDEKRDATLRNIGWVTLRIPAQLFYHHALDTIVDMVQKAAIAPSESQQAAYRLHQEILLKKVEPKVSAREAFNDRITQMVMNIPESELTHRWSNRYTARAGFANTSSFRRWLKREMSMFVEKYGL